MKPIDYRNETFAAVQARVAGGERRRAFDAWLAHGPGTTAGVAARASSDPRYLLTLRPRSTELFQMGFLRLAKEQPHGDEAVYCASTPIEAAAHFRKKQIESLTPQTELALNAHSS